jgi:hypothetical protein
MGLGLLALRFNARESTLYANIDKHVARGNPLIIFRQWRLLKRYIAVILVGAPIWGVVGLFITFTPEFAKALGMSVLPKTSMAVLFCYAGLAFGDCFSGLLSQYMRSRRKAVAVFLTGLTIFIGLYVGVRHDSLPLYYASCALMGLGAGYWAMFVQMGAEQFGTNIRATAATSIPNLVRGLTIPMTASFHALIPQAGVVGSGLSVLAVVMVMAFVALRSLGETFDSDLDYVER